MRTNDRRLSKIKYALRDWHFRKTWIFYEKRGIPFWFDDHRTRIKSVEGIKFNYVNDSLVWKIILNNVECRLEQFFPLTMRNIAYKIKFSTMKIMAIRVVEFSSRGYKIRKIFAYCSKFLSTQIQNWQCS